MRHIAILLSLLIAIAPWGGVLAQWSADAKASGEPNEAVALTEMPCHAHADSHPVSGPDSDDLGCSCCGKHDCQADSCHCGTGHAGIVSWPHPQASSPARQLHERLTQSSVSAELVPDSPPPIT